MRRGLAFFLSFSAAVFLFVYLLPPAALPWLALVFALGAGIALWRRAPRVFWLLLGAAVAFGWCWGYRALWVAPGEALAGRRTKITLVVADYPEAQDYGARLEGYIVGDHLPVKTLFYGPEDLAERKLGDRITVTADCSSSGRLYGETVRSYTSKGVFLRATARGSMTVEEAERTPWWCLPTVWAHELRRSIRAVFPADVAALMAGIVTGDRTGFDEGLSVNLSRTGTSHIVAVSGMHVCFLVGLLSMLTGRHPKRRAAVCVPVVFLFALTVGAAPSVMRASLMQTALLLAPLFGREEDSPTTIAVALGVLLAVNPYSAASIGLQLSFAAVVGIRVVSPRVSGRLFQVVPKGKTRPARALARVVRFLWATLSTTLGALAFTLPLSLFYFETLSLVAPVVNLLVLPAVSVLFGGGLLLGLLGLAAPAAAGALGGVLAVLGRYVLAMVNGFGGLPYSAVTVSDVYIPALAAGGYALLLIALLWRGGKRRAWVFLASAGVMTLAALLFTALGFRGTGATVAVLDVGQGQSVLLSAGGRTALVDCGGSGLTDAGDVAADYLQDRGVDRLDLLILTHFHDDHANGLEALFRRLEVAAVAVPDTDRGARYRELLLELAEAEGCPVEYVRTDEVRTMGDARLKLYAPLGDGDANEEGLSVLFSRGEFDLLITGDMNTVVEERLVKYGGLPDCEVLVAGHHGSRYATGDVLLNAAKPEVAVVSVGWNTYGHPSDETLRRLAAGDVAVYRTDRMGTITLQVG